MTTAIYGGSFNPPHLGHRSVAETVIRELKPDRFLIIPDYTAPHKQMAACTPEPQDRLELCRLAFAGLPGVEISEIEMNRGGKSYTVQTLEELQRLYPEDRFILVIGSDMLMSFEHGWHRFEDILRMCTLAVCSREENDIPLLQEHAQWLCESFGGDIRIVLNHAPVVASSTAVRDSIARGVQPEELTDAVWRYILDRGLYLVN